MDIIASLCATLKPTTEPISELISAMPRTAARPNISNLTGVAQDRTTIQFKGMREGNDKASEQGMDDAYDCVASRESRLHQGMREENIKQRVHETKPTSDSTTRRVLNLQEGMLEGIIKKPGTVYNISEGLEDSRIVGEEVRGGLRQRTDLSENVGLMQRHIDADKELVEGIQGGAREDTANT